MDTVELNVEKGRYVNMVIGNPPQKVKFILSFGHSEIYMKTETVLMSKTYTVDDMQGTGDSKNGLVGTELFYIGREAFRLPVIYTDSIKRSNTLFSGTFSGEIGLGRGSVLWSYWRYVTISRDRIVLGHFDCTMKDDWYLRGPMIYMDRDNHVYNYGKVYELKIDLDLLYHGIPVDIIEDYNLFINGTCGSEDEWGDTEQECSETYRIPVPGTKYFIYDRIDYNPIKISYDHDTVILGRPLLDTCIIFIDTLFWKCNISTYFSKYNHGLFNLFFILVIVLLSAIWILSTVTTIAHTRREMYFMICMMVYIHIVAVVSFGVNIFGFNTYRYYKRFSGISHWVPFDQWITCSIPWVIALWLIWSSCMVLYHVCNMLSSMYCNHWSINDVRKICRCNWLLFKIHTEITSLVIVWFCMLERHQDIFHLFFILPVSTFLAVDLTFLVLQMFVYSSRRVVVYSVILLAFIYYFVLRYTIFSAFCGSFGCSLFQMVTGYVYFILFVPILSMILYAIFQVKIIKATVTIGKERGESKTLETISQKQKLKQKK